jgi:hypothetical protein
MDDFASAVGLVRQKLHDIPSSVHEGNHYSDDLLAHFRDSPATRLLDIIGAVFHRSPEGAILRSHRRLSLERLVDLGSFSEVTKPQDAIFALRSLANDLKTSLKPDSRELLEPNYSRALLDVFAGFVLHCCRSGSLDIIICRPWVPSLSGTYTADDLNQFRQARMCSWLTAASISSQQYGKPLVRNSQDRIYNARNGTMPQVCLGKIETSGACNGSLYAKGIVLGEITRRSTRMANGIVTNECLNMLRTKPSDPQLSFDNLSDYLANPLCK